MRNSRAQLKNAECSVCDGDETVLVKKRSRSRSVPKGKSGHPATVSTETSMSSPPCSKVAKVSKTQRTGSGAARKINFGNEVKDSRKIKVGKNNNASPLPNEGECSQGTEDSM